MRACRLLVAFLVALSCSHARAESERVQVLLLDIESIDSEVPKDKVSILQGRIASALSERTDLDLVTSGDLKAMTALEAEKSFAGCDQSSCLAEIAAALGARYVVFGRVSKLDEHFLIAQLNLFDATAARAIGRTEITGSSLKELVERTPASVQQLFGKLAPTSMATANTPAASSSSPNPPHAGGALTLGGGIATAVGGSALLVGGLGAAWAEARLTSTDATLDERGNALTWGPPALWTAVGGGALLLVGAAVWTVGVVTE